MSTGCQEKNPLIRDGKSRRQRLLDALKPEYAKVDGRSISDLLNFIMEFAKDIQYYNGDNRLTGDWQAFFEKDVTTVIALIAEKSIENEKLLFEKLVEIINAPGSSESEVEESFKTIFDLLFTLIYRVDGWYGKALEGLGFHGFIKRIITSGLRDDLKKLISYYKGAIAPPLLFDISFVPDTGEYGVELENSETIPGNVFGDIWILKNEDGTSPADWNDYYSNIDADKSIYGPGRNNPAIDNSIKIRASQEKISILYSSIISGLSQLIDGAPVYIEETLKSYPEHEPHSSLMLAFLQLFSYAQKHINTITGRHLDFYYRDILKMDKKEAVPDKVHLIFELAKHIENHKIEEGILFKAGKDAEGKDVFYSSDSETVFNKGQIEELKTVFIDEEDGRRVYSAPVADSLDGQGEDFRDAEPKWKTFGQSQKNKVSDERTMADGAIGFAVSSPSLLLKEGVRYISLEVQCKDEPGIADLTELQKYFRFYLTGEEGWIDSKEINTISKYAVKYENKIYFVLSMDESISPIVNYDPEIHPGGYDTKFPMIRVELDSEEKSDYGYSILMDVVIEDILIFIYAGGVKDLVIQSDLGVIAPAKPFQPFGSRPALGSGFYIGSYEVFKKDLKYMAIELKWHNLPGNNLKDYYNYNDTGLVQSSAYDPANSDFKVDIDILAGGKWEEIAGDTGIFNSNASTSRYIIISSSSSELGQGTAPEMKEFDAYELDMKRGVIRLTLAGPDGAFGHSIYNPLLTKQILNEQKAVLPVEPYTPEIKEISLHYYSDELMNLDSPEKFDERANKFFHIYPFGHREIHSGISAGADMYLLPQFSHEDDAGEHRHEGEFYIGLSGLEPPQNISILFKVAEGSADPKLEKQDINWFYLVDNEWVQFETNEIISDSTNGLLTTGIISFAIPYTAVKNNSILNGEYYWVKASVNQSAGAVCDLISVKAQALTASFEDAGNDPGFLSTPLPADTISKLKISQAEVKKINQPYTSFGGKVKESDNEYYNRVSERLRHKDRGIAIWDYERLVLDAFPSIYKVKCINHSTYDYKDEKGNVINSEFAPGFVTLITVPDLANRNAVAPLEPRTSLNELDEIKTFLGKRISPFASNKLKVINPLFEEVQVEFYVKFRQGFDEGFYRTQVAEDINKFLSPWAFEEGEDIIFGGKIHKSVILNYVEERPYVDYVTDFKIHHFIEKVKYKDNIEEVFTTSARSVLVSHENHIINETSSCQ